MTLLEVYKAKNVDPVWRDLHTSLAKGKSGRMFEYTNTNYRTQKSFTKQFLKFQVIENLSRGDWQRRDSHGQEADKHRVVNLVQSKLFMKDSDGLYRRTAKGRLYSEFIESVTSESERWAINFLFLFNGYYAESENYIRHRVIDDLLPKLASIDGLSERLVFDFAKDFLVLKSLKTILRSPFFYLHSFYDDQDFIIHYLRSEETEREELAAYIESNIAGGNLNCCISKKYQSSGNFSISMVLDEARVFLLTALYMKSDKLVPLTAYSMFVGRAHEVDPALNVDFIKGYLQEHRSIFDPIFSEILEFEDPDATVQAVIPRAILQAGRDEPEDYIDETDSIGRLRIKQFFNFRKKLAREASEYRCELEHLNNCAEMYFTAQKTGRNYVEVHHLLPQEFRNDFSYSIEVLANYVTLCARCHRQIHLGENRARTLLINSLHEARKERLAMVGLDVDRRVLYRYYHIT